MCISGHTQKSEVNPTQFYSTQPKVFRRRSTRIISIPFNSINSTQLDLIASNTTRGDSSQLDSTQLSAVQLISDIATNGPAWWRSQGVRAVHENKGRDTQNFHARNWKTLPI